MACPVIHRHRVGLHTGRVPQNSGAAESRLCSVAALLTNLGASGKQNQDPAIFPADVVCCLHCTLWSLDFIGLKVEGGSGDLG